MAAMAVGGFWLSQVVDALHAMGFQLGEGEGARILAQLDPGHTGLVTREAVAASQLDWRTLQVGHRHKRDDPEHDRGISAVAALWVQARAHASCLFPAV